MAFMFHAVVPCSVCGSRGTEVISKPSSVVREGSPIDVYISWLCKVCKAETKPASSMERSPILMCAICQEPKRHTHKGKAERQWQEPPSALPVKSTIRRMVFVEMFACVDCNTQREFGIAGATP